MQPGKQHTGERKSDPQRHMEGGKGRRKGKKVEQSRGCRGWREE